MAYLIDPQYTYYRPVQLIQGNNGNNGNNGGNDGVNGNNNGNNGGVNGNNNGNNGGVNGNNNGNNGGVNGNNDNNGNNGGVNGNNDGANEANNPQQYKPNSSTLQMVDQFYYATYQWGTDDDKMEEVLKNINSSNVMDVMKSWNLVHSTEKGESFMEAFMWDADHGQKKEYGQKIASALRERAINAGVFEDCREDFAVIDNELRSWLYISNDITTNFDNIIAKITEAENSTNGEPYEASSQTNGYNSATRGMNLNAIA